MAYVPTAIAKVHGLSPPNIHAAVAAVGAGASVQPEGTIAPTVHSISRSVVCGVELSNATKYFLKTEGYFAAWGHVETPPSNISPGVKEAMVAYKSLGTATGTTGVAVWKIGNTNTRLVIEWSIPWNHNHHDNVLAAGFKEGEVELQNNLYREMYCMNETWFRRRGYTKDGHCRPVEISHRNKEFMIQGTMGTDHKCVARVQFIPLIKDAVAQNLKSAVFN